MQEEQQQQPEQKKETERKEVQERSSPSGKIVYKTILKEGEEELDRSSSALFWSGLAAGLSMGQVQGVARETLAFAREKAGEDTVGEIVGAIPGLSQFV